MGAGGATASDLPPEDCLRLLTALPHARSPLREVVLTVVDSRLAAPAAADTLRANPDLAARLADAHRGVLSPDDEPH